MNRVMYDRVMRMQSTPGPVPSTPIADRVERAASVARCLVALVDDLADERHFTMLDLLHVADLLTDELADLHDDAHAFEFPIVCERQAAKEQRKLDVERMGKEAAQ